MNKSRPNRRDYSPTAVAKKTENPKEKTELQIPAVKEQSYLTDQEQRFVQACRRTAKQPARVKPHKTEGE